MAESMQSIKNLTRSQINKKLSSLDNNLIAEKSLKTANTVLSLPLFKEAKNVAIYMHLPHSELHTDHIIKSCFQLGKTVYLPRIEKLSKFDDFQRFPSQKSCLHFLQLQSFEYVQSLKPRGKYQIREPEYTPNNSNDLLLNGNNLDIIFLPAVGFSKNCKRLGHGAGFYDDFIKRYRESHNGDCPTLIGLGLKEQIVDDHTCIVLEGHDEVLDYVIAEDEVFVKGTS